jgi:hypothetical protein
MTNTTLAPFVRTYTYAGGKIFSRRERKEYAEIAETPKGFLCDLCVPSAISARKDF